MSVVREGIRLSSRGGGFGTDPVTGAFSLSTDGEDGEPTTTLLAPDADPAADVVVPGELVHVDVDDSSLPGTVLTDEAGTHAWDRATGEELWEADVRPNGGCLVIRGRVYLTTVDRHRRARRSHGRDRLEHPAADVRRGSPRHRRPSPPAAVLRVRRHAAAAAVA